MFPNLIGAEIIYGFGVVRAQAVARIADVESQTGLYALQMGLHPRPPCRYCGTVERGWLRSNCKNCGAPEGKL